LPLPPAGSRDSQRGFITRTKGENSVETGQTQTDIESEIGLYRFSEGPCKVGR
jgi:hypothetical protein